MRFAVRFNWRLWHVGIGIGWRPVRTAWTRKGLWLTERHSLLISPLPMVSLVIDGRVRERPVAEIPEGVVLAPCPTCEPIPDGYEAVRASQPKFTLN